MAGKTYFTPELFRFLGELKRHNNRDWFMANKPRYEQHVRDPFLRFIADFAPVLKTISPRFIADPRPIGGSLFRIYRDTRFSKDKSPYKTTVGAHFPHFAGEDVHVPGFYLHLAPGEVFAGSGIWHPDGVTAAKVRAGILSQPARWRAALSGPAFKRLCRLEGESLKRPPAGVSPDHPLAEDLKRKDFVVTTRFTESQACRPDFMDRFTEACRAAAPLVEFLTKSLGLPW